MATFGLVHGAWHGAWCWARLIPELQAMGHRAVAVDLPCEDPGARFDDYADAVVRGLEWNDEVVLVGHSLGAHTIPLVALARPVLELVFVCGVIPQNLTYADEPDEPPMDEPGTFDALLKHPDGSTSWGSEEAAIAAMYADCEPEGARIAVSNLRRQAQGIWEGFGPIDPWPDVPCVSILCREDRVLSAEWGRWAARGRLGGVVPIELPGGHSPFMSRPVDLARILVDSIAGVS